MPRAEAGSTKAISNKLKSKGLTRLRWYCQVCEKACRDANGFSCHVKSESHVRRMLVISEDSKATIEKYSAEFLREFIDLLRTTHGEKKVHLNQFYQQVISKKDHIHMNATKWSSLTQFAAYLGREGIARMEETEKGLFVSWIDNSPETLRRREAVMKKERQDKGDEEREQRLIQEQVERARAAAATADKSGSDDSEDAANAKSTLLERKEGDKVKLSFGSKAATATASDEGGVDKTEKASEETKTDAVAPVLPPSSSSTSKPNAISFSSSTTTKPKNIFSMKPTTGVVKSSNAFASAGKKSGFVPQQQKMSQQEIIMRREMEAAEQKNNKKRGFTGGNNNGVFRQQDGMKRQRVS